MHHGSSLHWDSFILFYNLLCKIDDSNCMVSALIYIIQTIINKCVYMHVSLAIKIVPRLCQGLPCFGNDSRRIQEVFNRATTCMYVILP